MNQAKSNTHQKSPLVYGKYCLFLFVLGISYLLYFQSVQKKNASLIELQTKLQKLEMQKEKALILQDNLQAKLASLCEPEFIKLTLMEKLGVVPDGQIKVHFR